MKILITGAAGFVGAAVVSQAVNAGHEVVATVRPSSRMDRLINISPSIALVKVDLRDLSEVSVAMREYRPDVIVHTAWSGVDNKSRNDRSQITDNVQASCNLIDAGAVAGVRKFVGLGSQGEYGLLSGKISEGDLPLPTSLYGAAKLAVLHLTRQIAAQSDMSFVWLRPFSTYGPGDNPHWLIPSLIETMLNGERPKTSLGVQRWDYLFIDDVARGILAAAVAPDAKGIFNLGSGQPATIRSIVEQIRDLVSPGLELVFGEVEYRLDQIWHMEADISRLTTATAWIPSVELRSGLEKTIAWHRSVRLAPTADAALD
jgi:nucleoside-diphosphate-sugar epimerase